MKKKQKPKQRQSTRARARVTQTHGADFGQGFGSVAEVKVERVYAIPACSKIVVRERITVHGVEA